jgi:hypothetical protein
LAAAEKLKGWQTSNQTQSPGWQEAKEWEHFSLAGFYDKLIHWIAIDDQVS